MFIYIIEYIYTLHSLTGPTIGLRLRQSRPNRQQEGKTESMSNTDKKIETQKRPSSSPDMKKNHIENVYKNNKIIKNKNKNARDGNANATSDLINTKYNNNNKSYGVNNSNTIHKRYGHNDTKKYGNNNINDINNNSTVDIHNNKYNTNKSRHNNFKNKNESDDTTNKKKEQHIFNRRKQTNVIESYDIPTQKYLELRNQLKQYTQDPFYNLLQNSQENNRDECILCCCPIVVYVITPCVHSGSVCAKCILRIKLFSISSMDDINQQTIGTNFMTNFHEVCRYIYIYLIVYIYPIQYIYSTEHQWRKRKCSHNENNILIVESIFKY